MEGPLVSVVVTTYNQEQYIEDALRSVLAQSFTDYEVVVVDDGSTDGTAERLAAFNDAVRLIRQPNKGIADSRNTGVSHAQGQYIAFLDGDDIWHEEKLAIQVRAAQEHPGSGLIAVDGIQFSDDGTVLSHTLFTRGILGETVGTQEVYMQLLQAPLIWTVSQVMVPAAVLRSIGPSDSRFPRASDYDLYLRIARRYPFTLVRRSLVRWRYSATSASGPQELRGMRYLAENIQIAKKNAHQADPGSRKQIQAVVAEKVHWGARRLYQYGRSVGDRPFATRGLLGLLGQHPTSLWVTVYLVALWTPPCVTNYVVPRLRALRDATASACSHRRVRQL